MHERRQQTNPWPAYAGSRLKLSDALGRHRRKCQPSSRTGENPPYGMIGGIEETSASCEARYAPRSYPTELEDYYLASPPAVLNPRVLATAALTNNALRRRTAKPVRTPLENRLEEAA